MSYIRRYVKSKTTVAGRLFDDNPVVDRQIKMAENQTYYTRFMNSALLFLLICASLTF